MIGTFSGLRFVLGSRTTRQAWNVVLFALTIFASLVLVSPAVAKTDERIERPTLYWRNGDTLPGEIHSANTDAVHWRADPFLDPLQIQHKDLQMIRFPSNPDRLDVGTEEPQQIIETHEGNRFFGKISSSDSDNLVVATDLFGQVTLKRSAIHLIANPIERAHVYSGPKGLRGWSTLTYGRKLSEWEEIASGRLRTKMVAAELSHTVTRYGMIIKLGKVIRR